MILPSLGGFAKYQFLSIPDRWAIFAHIAQPLAILLQLLNLDFNIHASGQIQAHQHVNRF
jgi:hypothetical protein